MIKSELCFGCLEPKNSELTCQYCGYVEGTERESVLHLQPGTFLEDRYLLGRVLGQGGFGITYLAWDMKLNIKLAIKEYLPQQLAYRTGTDYNINIYKRSLFNEFNYGLNKFMDEARTLARFNEHPNIVTIHDYFEANNTAYLVMNFHNGITLQNYLERKGGRILIEEALSIFMPVLDALKEVHTYGILHRDISPDNLLIDRNGRVILIDFGAARQAMSQKSHSFSVIMKPGYSPEEQYRRKGEQGPWSDIYALAASFYRSITGMMPPEALDRLAGDTLIPPSALGINIDKNLEQSILKALAVKSENRYQTANEFLEILLASDINPQLNNQEAPEAENVIFNEEIAATLVIAEETASDEEDKKVEMAGEISYLVAEEETETAEKTKNAALFDQETEAVEVIDEVVFPDKEITDTASMHEHLVADESMYIKHRNTDSANYFSYIKNHKLLFAVCSLAGLLVLFAAVQLILANSNQRYQAALNEQQDHLILTEDEKLESEEKMIVLKPSIPVLTGPEDGSIESGSEATIEWQPVEGADKYIVLLTETSTGESTEHLLGNITHYKIKDLPGAGKVYSVQIAAGNSAGWSKFTEPISITIGTVAQKPKIIEQSQKQPEEKTSLTPEEEMRQMREKIDALEAEISGGSFGGPGDVPGTGR